MWICMYFYTFIYIHIYSYPHEIFYTATLADVTDKPRNSVAHHSWSQRFPSGIEAVAVVGEKVYSIIIQGMQLTEALSSLFQGT